jgi:hypothetical protein
MKYFGKKSLSSAVSRILHVFWYVVLVGSIITAFLLILNMFNISFGDPITSEIAKFNGMDNKDKESWEEFKNIPFFLKFIIFPYFGAFVVLVLQIIKKSRLLFINFKNDIVFNKSNAVIISTISKLNIVLAIITVNFSSLLASVLLFMLCEIFKKGSALQEEHDFTV